MVICKFFQTGNCRFGTKCANEHFDVKQLIKTEIEAALQGRQWPLSSFGPFKEKPCFPNFIEDQSFEEIRYHCYEAKKQNYFPNFEQQFNQQVMEAQNKMKTLLTLSREIVDIVTTIYDTNSESGQQNPSTFTANPNPFATIGSNNNTQQPGSLFGNQQQQQQVNPFAKATTQNEFVGSGTGIFGSTTGQSSASGILGQSTFGNSIFGGNNPPQQHQPSIFSSPIGQQPQQQTTFTGFGQQSQSIEQQSANLFSQPPQQQQHASSIFGGQIQSQTQQPSFGANIFGQPSQAQPQTNLFGQPAVQPTGGNIFAQANQKLQQSSGFGGFGQPQSDQQQFSAPQTQSLFGAQAQQNPQIQQQNMFATQQQPQPQQQQPQAQQQQPNQIFAQQQPNQMVQAQPQQSLFVGANQQQQPQQNFNQMNPTQNQNIFTQPQQTVVQNQPLPHQLQQSQTAAISGQVRIGVYSKMEDLTEEEMEAFKAENFIPGKIPCNPPPRELC